ncbi:MAG TPA: amidase [Solirubrobacteraceae bacterium]|nr:amidase [Solirubrobacteraceae bacterium]
MDRAEPSPPATPTGDAELAFAGIARQAQLIAAGEVSSRELVELCLRRIERLDRPTGALGLNAFRVVLGERALLEADQADARRGAGGEAGRRPLLGVPIAVKDNIDVAGELTCEGTNAVEQPARADAEVVRRLREAGAVVIGKTNVPELCMWPFTETATFGVTRNPWDLQHAPGGSSGGSAAAVAAGLVGAALGSDGAGSIRIPSAWCGLFGLKPARGRVPLAPHPRHWHGLSVIGLLSRRVADTALFHDVASGPSEVDLDRAPAPPVPFAQAAATPAGKLRIAYSTRTPPGIISRLDAHAERALHQTVELLRSLGHELVERDPDYGPAAGPALTAHYLRGIHDDAAKVAQPQRLERRTRGMDRLGALVTPALLERAQRAAAELSARLGRLFEQHHALLTPATAAPPPPIGRLQGRGALATLNTVAGWVPYNGVWNLTGQPAASVPAGLGADGLPRAVQIVGRAGDEPTLLALAAQLEAERPWADQRPPGCS